MRFYKTPGIINGIFPGLTWQIKESSRTLYLTFDDGPIPQITPFVLETLAKYKARATFFCVGENIDKHPEVFQKIIAGGHTVGNHTHRHLPGWNTVAAVYRHDIDICQRRIEAYNVPQPNKLFRPPYGKITPLQYLKVTKDYQIIMWDVLTYDFDKKLSPDLCLKKAIQNTQPGSIIVFHDSIKAARNLTQVLPRYIEHFATQGYRFAAL